MKVKEIERLLAQAGWTKEEGAKHTKWIQEGRRPVMVPRHKGDLPLGTALAILKQAGVK